MQKKVDKKKRFNRISDRLFLIFISLPVLICIVSISPLFPDFLELGSSGVKSPGSDKKRDSDIIREKDDMDVNLMQTDTYPEDLARNVEARLVSLNPKEKNIRITWEFKFPVEDKKYTVFRSNKLLNKTIRLTTASVVGVFDSGETSIIDKNLDSGVYYYAVIERTQVSQPTVFLFADVNYTSKPVVVELSREKRKKGKGLEDIPTITKIGVKKVKVGTNFYVEVTWKALENLNVIYTVYRSRQPIKNSRRILASEKLAELPAGSSRYLDTFFQNKGTYYYAVTPKFISGVSGKESFYLIPGDSYSTKGIQVNPAVKVPIVQSITAKMVKEGNLIQVEWKLPDLDLVTLESYKFRLYRSFRPIKSSSMAATSDIIKNFSYNDTKYVDINPLEGENFYCITTISEKGVESWDFLSGKNYTIEGIYFHKPEKVTLGPSVDFTYSDFFKKIEAFKDPGGIMVRWQWAEKIPLEIEDVLVYIIRTEQIPLDFETVRANGMIVDQFFVKERKNGIIDPWIQGPGPFYYTLLVGKESDKILPMKFIDGVNVYTKGVIAGKVIKKRQVKTRPDKIDFGERIDQEFSLSERQSEMGRINNILNDYYYHSRYRKSYRELRKFTKSGDLVVKSKALLYQGRCLYKLGFYRKSLLYFLDKGVNKFYKDEAVFWRQSAYYKLRR